MRPGTAGMGRGLIGARADGRQGRGQRGQGQEDEKEDASGSPHGFMSFYYSRSML